MLLWHFLSNYYLNNNIHLMKNFIVSGYGNYYGESTKNIKIVYRR